MTATAVALAGCSTRRAGTADELGPPQVALPDVTPSLYVPPLYGTASIWHLNDEMALALQRHDIAASTGGANGASYVLYSMAEAEPVSDGHYEVTIYWDLVEPGGELVGTVSQTERMTAREWDTVPPDLPKLADRSAARVIHVVPGRKWGPTDPVARLAAREEREKLDERRRLYRKMAARGGLGPLSKRIFVHAEQKERRTQRTLARKRATALAEAKSDSLAVATPRPPMNGVPADDVEASTVERPSPPAEPSKSGHWASLGAFPDEADARSHWLRLRLTHADLFTGREVGFSAVDMGDRGTFQRVDAGPFAEVAEVAEFCAALKTAAVDCTVPRAVETPTVADREAGTGQTPATANLETGFSAPTWFVTSQDDPN